MFRRTIAALRSMPPRGPGRQLGFSGINSVLREVWQRARVGDSSSAGIRRLWSSKTLPKPRASKASLRAGEPRRSFHTSRPRRSNKQKPDVPPEHTELPDESLTLSQRMRKLSREYGWATVGVYIALSVADFPFCFLLVRLVGTDKIAEVEHWIISKMSRFVPASIKDLWHQWKAKRAEAAEADDGGPRNESADGDKWGVKEAQENHREEASLATQLALAYAVHKSFIFIRVPLTAAITPRVVKTLRSWGWEIGKRRPKA